MYALLIRESSLNDYQIQKHYLYPLEKMGVDLSQVIVHSLLYEGKKVRATIAKAYLTKLREKLDLHPIKQLIIADGPYFKFLTGVSKVAKTYGDCVDCTFEGYTDYTAVYVPNWQQLFYDPSAEQIIEQGLRAAVDPTKKDIVSYYDQALDSRDAESLLTTLLQRSDPALACDIETTGLSLGDTEIVSISFAWNESEGVAIYCYRNSRTHELLRNFFSQYGGRLIFHHSLFDVKHLIWNLYMTGPGDTPGMHRGLSVFRHVEDSLLLTYLALNSTTDISLGLKENSYEYTGNYALDLKDVLSIPPDELLQYNAKDCMATWYVWNKYWPVCEQDDQLRVYARIFQPSIIPLLHMMLVGLPIDLEQVDVVANELRQKQQYHEDALKAYPEVVKYTHELRYRAMRETNTVLKKKFRPFSDFQHVTFNPDSPQQVAELLYDRCGYTVTQRTETGQPASGTKILVSKLGQGSHDDLLHHIIERKKTSKILTSFIPAFRKYTVDGYLHGEFNLGGTQSGRLSSTRPNLQNLPAGSTYGKKIKSCFKAKDGWLFWGIDFNALEERIGSILSGDPNRIKVYTEGYDGHCLRAYRYFGEQMPDINPDDPTSINSIAQRYPELRNQSKAPSFALQYLGSYFTLMKNCGFDKKTAQKIEKEYHKLYAVSDEFVEQNMQFAEDNGYVECAFGLRLRTPLIQRSVRKSTHAPSAVAAEGRSANNAITQSWGLLLNRALIDVYGTIMQSAYAGSILFCNAIHDALYGVVRHDGDAVRFLNDVIVPAMEWNEDPKIQSAEVPMSVELEIGYSWDSMTGVPNGATAQEINDVIDNL